MQRIDWDRLAAPFGGETVFWRVLEVAPDGESARVEPRLAPAAIASRLDQVCGPEGWSLRFVPFPDSICCELTVAGALRSAVVERAVNEGVESCSHAALAAAARLFGMDVPERPVEEVWVDYDADERQAMLPESASASPTGDYSTSLADPYRPGEAGGPGDAPQPEEQKSEGQQAIDRLVERLKLEGKGLEAAKLLVDYGGYGRDPDTARELYRKLRHLLTAEVESRA